METKNYRSPKTFWFSRRNIYAHTNVTRYYNRLFAEIIFTNETKRRNFNYRNGSPGEIEQIIRRFGPSNI